MQVSNTVNTVGISSNALEIQLTSLNCNLSMPNFYQHSNFCADYHLFLFMQKLRKHLTLTSKLTGRK